MCLSHVIKSFFTDEYIFINDSEIENEVKFDTKIKNMTVDLRLNLNVCQF